MKRSESGDRAATNGTDPPEFKLLIENNADGIVVLDQDGIVLFANPAAQDMFGRQAGELIGSPVGIPVIAGETTEITLLRPGREAIEAELRIVETAWRGRRALLASLRDITMRRLAEKRLSQAQKMEAIGQLTAGIAHDFNNLLTVALGNLEMLQHAIGEAPKLHKMVNATFSALARAERLTTQLLAFSRRQRLEPAPLDVNQVLTGMEDLLRRAVGSEVEIEYFLKGRLPAALADVTQLETALLNIAANARDAMPNGGRFTIETGAVELDAAYVRNHPEASPGDYVAIIATDTGTGMPPEILRRVFEPFFSTKEPGKGTGLGLPMVYGFVRQSGGHVAIESRPGRGTRVGIYLPAAGSPPEAAVSLAQDAEPALPSGNETVLVVEDDAAVRALACAMLRELGYTVVEVANAETALQLIKSRGDLDLVFSDVVMPGSFSGLDLAKEILESRPDLGIVLTSGYTSRYTDPDGIIALVEFVRKPYRQTELAAGFRLALSSRRQ